MPAVPLGKDSALQSDFPALAEKDASYGTSVAIWFCIQATVLLPYPSLGYQPAANPRKRRRQAAGGLPILFAVVFGRRVETLLVFACSGQIPSGLQSVVWWHHGDCRNRQKGNCRNLRSGLERCKRCVHCAEGRGCKLSSTCALPRSKIEETKWLVMSCFVWGSFWVSDIHSGSQVMTKHTVNPTGATTL